MINVGLVMIVIYKYYKVQIYKKLFILQIVFSHFFYTTPDTPKLALQSECKAAASVHKF